MIGSTSTDEKTHHCSEPSNADLNAAYNQENYLEANVAHHDSSEIRDGRANLAANSLEEGIEQTLTLHKLSVENKLL